MCDEDVSQSGDVGPDHHFVSSEWSVWWVNAGILEGPGTVLGCVRATVDTQRASAYGEFD